MASEKRRLDVQSVVRTIKEAFRPLECVVELYDFDKRIRFGVFAPEEKLVLDVPEYLMRRATDPDSLNNIITRSRKTVEKQGYELEPWTIQT